MEIECVAMPHVNCVTKEITIGNVYLAIREGDNYLLKNDEGKYDYYPKLLFKKV